MNPNELRKGGRYNWRNQPERLIYMGTAQYPGDRRTWHQFAKVESPDVVWSEVLESDLQSFEETAPMSNPQDEREALSALAYKHCFKASEMPSQGVQLYMFDLERLDRLCAALATQQAGPDSYESIWNALQRIDSVAAMLPTYTVDHDGGIEAFTQNIVDAITRIATQQAVQGETVLPRPGSPEASAMIDSLLAEYQWPSNPKNAARAGFEAARRMLATPPAPGQVERDREDADYLCKLVDAIRKDVLGVFKQYGDANAAIGLMASRTKEAIRAARSSEGGSNG
jgi:hypothetical protein